LTIFLTVDTCVWISIASRPVLTPALDHLEEALRGDVKLVVPSVVLDELKRHLPDTVDRAVKSLAGQLKASKDAAGWITSPASADAVRSAVDAVLKDLDAGSHSVKSVSDRILGFVEAADAVRVDTDDALKVAAMDRALTKRAPCHNSKNNVADALIVEASLRLAMAMNTADRLVLVSENTKEFSSPTDQRAFHPDLENDLSPHRITFSTNLSTVLGDVAPAQRDQPLASRFDEILAERSAVCPECKGPMIGHWFNSQYGGGLSWHLTCQSCRCRFDTGEYYD
jgi:hypothetical protein